MVQSGGSERGGSQPDASSTGLEPNVAALLCYLLGLVTGIAFLVIEQKSSFVRFHAAQSTFTSAALVAVSIVADAIPLIGSLVAALVWPAGVVLWIVLMAKAYAGERFKLPVVGDFAEGQSRPPTG